MLWIVPQNRREEITSSWRLPAKFLGKSTWEKEESDVIERGLDGLRDA